VREGEGGGGGRAIEREATAGLGFCAGWRWIGFAELGSVKFVPLGVEKRRERNYLQGREREESGGLRPWLNR
jgi:hypothetical protein